MAPSVLQDRADRPSGAAIPVVKASEERGLAFALQLFEPAESHARRAQARLENAGKPDDPAGVLLFFRARIEDIDLIGELGILRQVVNVTLY